MSLSSRCKAGSLFFFALAVVVDVALEKGIIKILTAPFAAATFRSPKDSHKPVRIPLPHPLMDPRKNPVCLLVKDPQREYKDLLEEKKIKFVSRVVGMEKLQGKVREIPGLDGRLHESCRHGQQTRSWQMAVHHI